MTDATLEKKREIVAGILDRLDWYRRVDLAKSGTPGQFVITGLQAGGREMSRIGFCVQVRKGCGQFGSDMVILRHHDGSLCIHENQSFYAMSAWQEAGARQIFEDLPEDEDYSHGYLARGVRETGFVIEESSTQPTPNTPFSVTTSSRGPDGEESRTVTVIV